MPTSLSRCVPLNALTVSAVPPVPTDLPPVVQQLQDVRNTPAQIGACRGFIPAATGKVVKTRYLTITGIISRDLRGFSVDIHDPSFNATTCHNLCLYELKKRRLLFYTQMYAFLQPINLLCLYAINDGVSHATLLTKKYYNNHTRSIYKMEFALSSRANVTFFALSQINRQGERQQVFALGRTADNGLFAQVSHYRPGCTTFGEEGLSPIDMGTIGVRKHDFIKLAITTVWDRNRPAILVQAAGKQGLTTLFCYEKTVSDAGCRYQARFGLHQIDGHGSGDSWMFIRAYREKHRKLS